LIPPPKNGGKTGDPSNPHSDRSACYVLFVTLTLKAKVRGGRLVLDEPIDLPDGSEVDLVPADAGDNLDDEGRARLDGAIDRAVAQVRAGAGVSADEAFARLGIRDVE